MFSGPVKEVKSTQIFARFGEGVSQFIAYKMHINAKQPVAMVLPLPIDQSKGDKALRFIDLSEYEEFFAALDAAFYVPTKGDGTRSMPMTASAALIEVQKVGAFEASYVPALADFARLDPRFQLPKNVWEQLPEYKDWGFAVFKLREGEQRIHPMAFSFERRSAARLFFPTVHVHDGKVHATAEFDHMLYCQPGERGLELKGWTESQGPASKYLELAKTKGIVDGERHCYRRKLKGRLRNQDTYTLTN